MLIIIMSIMMMTLTVLPRPGRDRAVGANEAPTLIPAR